MTDRKTMPRKDIMKSSRTAVFPRKFSSKLTYKGVPVIEISVSYPHVEVYGNPRVSQHLSYFYRSSAKRYYDKASHELYDAAVEEYLSSAKQHYPFRPFKVIQDFDVPYNKNNLLSICCERCEYTSGVHVSAEKSADTYLTTTGRRMKLENFFEDSYYKSVIFENITSEIKQQKEGGCLHYFDDYLKNVFRFFDENNYYLADSGFAVFYQPHTIADYALGIPSFIIPYENFGASLKQHLFR